MRSQSLYYIASAAGARLTSLLVSVLLACAILAADGGTSNAYAQTGLDYSKILGGGKDDEPQISRPVASPRPAAEAGTPAGPDLADYARVTDGVSAPALGETKKAVELFRARILATIKGMPGSWREIRTALAAASPTGRPSYFIGVALFAGLLLLIGRAVMSLYGVYLARPIMVGLQSSTAPVGYLGKLPVLAYRLFLTTVGIVISLIVSIAIGLLFYQEHEATLVTVVVVFAAVAMINLVDTIWRMALAPYLAPYRLPTIGDADARSMYRWLSRISAFGIVSMALTYWMQMLGLTADVHTALTVVLSFIAVVAMLVMLGIHRRPIRAMIYGGRPREMSNWVSILFASVWRPAVTLYLLITWGDLSFRLIMGIEAPPFRLAMPYLIFMAGLIVYAVAMYVIERVFDRTRKMRRINAEAEEARRREEAAETLRLREQMAGDTDSADDDEDAGGSGVRPAPATQPGLTEPPADPPPEMIEVEIPAHQRNGSSMQTMEDLARRTASLFAIGAIAYALIRFWGGPDVFQTVPVLGLVQDVIDIVLIGYIVFHALRIWIDRKIAEEDPGADDDAMMEGEGGGAGASRLATLLPLCRNFLLIVIVVAVLLLLAVELGVNVAPLFAGAGIVGLAIGFGAQTLVRDILSGAFFLVDDAFRKGEYIDVGEVKGTVEKISLRSFQLRHHLGKLHTIPFGEIKHLTNFSRDWVMMKLPLRVTYDTDVERVRKLIKKLGLRLLEDPEIGSKFIQPVKSQGVIQMDDSAMILRIKFMTYPGEQWVLRKRIFAEIRILFEAEGIKFAHREVTVRIPDLEKRDAPLSAQEQHAVGAAARRAADQAQEEMLGQPTAMGDAR